MIRDLMWENGDFVLDVRGEPELVQDTQVVIQDLRARLLCPKGAHWAHLQDGIDILPYVQGKVDDLSLLELEQEIELECQNDDRVWRAEAVVTVMAPGQLQVAVTATLTDQTLIEFGLSLGVS